MKEIKGSDNYVIIPDDSGKFNAPLFVDKNSTVVTNYDEVKAKNKLSSGIKEVKTKDDAIKILKDNKDNLTDDAKESIKDKKK